MANPKISVVIPTRNRAQYLHAALDSVFAQTLQDYEIIVVDDGSTDATREILASLIANGKIKYLYQESRGVSSARNRGVNLSQAPYIAFLDSDDLFLPTKLEKQMRVFEDQPRLGFVHCSFSKFDDSDHELGMRDTSRFQGRIYPRILQEWSVLMAMPCMLVRTDVMKEVGGFDEEMNWAEDLDLWRRIARRYAVGTVPESLVRVRVHAASTTFSKTGGAAGFERYLEKAFAEDPALNSLFRRIATAKMYTKLGQNLLGEGGPVEMKLVRQHSVKALSAWPLQLGAAFGWLASFVPAGWRQGLVNAWRRIRYPAAES